MTGHWINRLALGGCALLLGACAQTRPPLYAWDAFPKQQYETLLTSGNQLPADQLLALQAHAEKTAASGGRLPPGFRAHLGMLKLSVGDAVGARELWQGEKSAFPESAPFMDRLLKRLEAPRTVENPA